MVRIYQIVPVTEVNGPGRRFCIWFQGCTRNCKGCYNPETHPLLQGQLIPVDDILQSISIQANIEGISISGGEPFLQYSQLGYLLKRARENLGLSSVVYTGYTLRELMEHQPVRQILSYIDLLIAGPFIESMKTNLTLLPSMNQKIHFLSDRYNPGDLDIPQLEATIGYDGEIICTGIVELQ